METIMVCEPHMHLGLRGLRFSETGLHCWHLLPVKAFLFPTGRLVPIFCTRRTSDLQYIGTALPALQIRPPLSLFYGHRMSVSRHQCRHSKALNVPWPSISRLRKRNSALWEHIPPSYLTLLLQGDEMILYW